MLAEAPSRPTTGWAVRWTDWLVWAAIFAYLALHLPFLAAWPTAHNDEARELNAFWVATGVDPNARLLDTEFGADPLYKGGLQGLTVGLALKLFGLGLLQGRVVSLLWGGVLLGVTYLLGRRLYGALAGLLATVALAVSHPFLVSSHMVRPDVVLAAMLVAAAWLALHALQEHDLRAALASGLLAGFSFDVHLNAIAFMPLLGLIFLSQRGRKVLLAPESRLFALGLAVGVAYFLVVRVLSNPGLFVSSSSYWIGIDKRPPILAMSPPEALGAEIGRFSEYVTEDRRMEALWIGVALLVAAWASIRQRLLDPILGGALLAFVAFTLLVSGKSQFYMILYEPWLALLLGALLAAVARMLSATLPTSIRLPPSVPALGLAILVLFVFGVSDDYDDMTTAASNLGDKGYYAMIDDVRRVVPTGARILGPPLFWLGLADHPYTDYYVWERLRAMPGREHFSSYMERSTYEIVILDAKARHQVAINSPGYLESRGQLLTSFRRVGFDRTEVWKLR